MLYAFCSKKCLYTIRNPTSHTSKLCLYRCVPPHSLPLISVRPSVSLKIEHASDSRVMCYLKNRFFFYIVSEVSNVKKNVSIVKKCYQLHMACVRLIAS